jgi:hypothetical protein
MVIYGYVAREKMILPKTLGNMAFRLPDDWPVEANFSKLLSDNSL